MYDLAKRRLHAVVHLLHLAQHAGWELTEYFTELTQGRRAEFFRPNLWPNTPDILPELSAARRPAGLHGPRSCWPPRSAANYGIYGPAFELLEHEPRLTGSEEYLDSEKYQLRSWDLDDPLSIAPILATDEPDPPREPGPARQRLAPVPRRRPGRPALLQQDEPRPRQCDRGGRQPRPVRRPRGPGVPRPARARRRPLRAWTICWAASATSGTAGTTTFASIPDGEIARPRVR